MEILWEDPTCLVVNKPAGLLTQGASGIETLETRLREFLRQRDHHPGEPYIAFPHRIDRPVSGTLLVARNVRAVQRFGGQFQSRKIGKVYWALASGCLQEERGTWEDTMRKIPNRSLAEIVAANDPEGRQAILHYQVIARAEDGASSWVEVKLETGRMHQIRLQFAARGFPLLGDALYGAHLPFGPKAIDPREQAIALHARSIQFRHPVSGVEITITAPLPHYWAGCYSEMESAVIS